MYINKACKSWGKKKGTSEYEKWAQLHFEECQANHAGSVGKMEVDSAVEMFARSQELNGVECEDYIGDGDCKIYKIIMESSANKNIKINKKECIDHVQKRMGTLLRNLKKKSKKTRRQRKINS